MGYNTLGYLLVFLPASLILYGILPQKFRSYFLLLASWTYFYLLSGTLLKYLIGTIVFVYLAAMMIDSGEKKSRKRKLFFFLSVFMLFGVLIVLKYSGFIIENMNRLLSPEEPFRIWKFLMPIGISFYTLEAVGYLVEVYWGRIKAEHNFLKLALFLSFFPQTMEGPIARYEDTAEQLMSGTPLTEKNIRDGAMRIIWGMFKKLVIADRLNTVVSVLYTTDKLYSGIYIIIAAVAYAVQLYMEFSGVMDIVIGSGQMFGISLPENFRQPFFSKNASEFWRRWHITLGVWLKTYVFYPISTSKTVKKWNKFSRKRLGKQWSKIGTSALALFPVWLFNGIWHGAQWNYIFYGMYYFVILMLEVILEPVKLWFLNKVHAEETDWWWVGLQIAKTWVIIFVGELFFRAQGLKAGFRMFMNMFKDFSFRPLFDGSLLKLGIDRADWFAIGVGMLIVFVFDILKEREWSVMSKIDGLKLPARWVIYYAAILVVVIFGAYGYGYRQVDLIYAGF